MTDLTRPGKLSYIQIPATDAAALGKFYEAAFGWTISPGRPDHVSFEDASGELIGAFVTQWTPGAPGVLPYISVTNVDATLAVIQEQGGSVDTPPYAEGNLTVARFRDPSGNVIGIWKMPAG
jgi:predicted enzyme related to lactoylglutathione lyase